jgi:transglutaminase-like putative cysteine protease
MLRRPALMATLNGLGAAPMLGLRSAGLPARLSPGLCLLVIPATTRPDVLGAGRTLQRVWLQATLEGLSVQPYAAAGVLSLGWVRIEPRFDRVLARLQADMRRLCPGEHGLVFLRLGYTRSAPRSRSARRALASFS